MSREMQEWMDEIAEEEKQKTLDEAVITIMKKLKYSLEQAMDFLDIPLSNRSAIAGPVNRK